MSASPIRARSASDDGYAHPRDKAVARTIDVTSRDDLRDLCRAMLRWIDAERSATDDEVMALPAGRRLDTGADGTRYCFAGVRAGDASAGDPVSVTFERGRGPVEGMIDGVADDQLVITLREDLGRETPPGTMRLAHEWLLERLRQRVIDAFADGLQAPGLFNLDAALPVVGCREIHLHPVGPAPEYEDQRRPLTEGQAAAVGVVRRSPLSIILAPAGAGKSVVLGAVIESCYRAGLRTLVAAPSNQAVDRLMAEACERLEGCDGFGRAEVLRVGADVSPDLRAAHGTSVVVDDVIARLRPDLARQRDAIDRRIAALAAEITHRRAQHGDAADCGDHRRRLAAVRAERREVYRQHRDYARRLVGQARVVAMTSTAAYLDRQGPMYDVVVVDEASMVRLPVLFVLAGLARQHVVCAGDPYQLRAPTAGRHGVDSWLSQDVFWRLGLLRAVADDDVPPYLTMLDEQRRCADDICELLRTVWYGPRLRTAPEVRRRERERRAIAFPSAVCYVNTGPLDPRTSTPWGRTSANATHAALVSDLVAYLDAAGELGAAGGEHDVLVVAPFRGQAAATRQLLRGRLGDRSPAVRTVHGAQGAEAATVIVDLTVARGTAPRGVGLLTATRLHEDGARLLCVACSRARSRLILLGDLDWIARSTAPHSVLARVVAHVTEHGYAIRLRDIAR